MCGDPQYFKEILFKVKEILLSVCCKYVIRSSLGTRKVLFRPNNAFISLVVVFRLQKMIISSININFSLFPDTVAVKYCYDYSHKICQTSLNQEAYGSRLWRPPVCGGSCHGRAFFHLEIETKNQKFQENLKLASKFRLIYSQLLLQ